MEKRQMLITFAWWYFHHELMKEIKALILKDLKLEWRNKYALNGMLLYVVSTVFVCYLSFKLKIDTIEPITWNTLFWIILLFVAINAIARSFAQENKNRNTYYYLLAKPENIIMAKIIYNFVLMLLLSTLGLIIYGAFMGNPVIDLPVYFLGVVLGAFGFSSCLTLMSAIAAKADNAASLMALLSFPIIIPILIMLIRLSKNAMDGLLIDSSLDEIYTLVAIDGIVIALSFLLFPYLWKT